MNSASSFNVAQETHGRKRKAGKLSSLLVDYSRDKAIIGNENCVMKMPCHPASQRGLDDAIIKKALESREPPLEMMEPVKFHLRRRNFNRSNSIPELLVREKPTLTEKLGKSLSALGETGRKDTYSKPRTGRRANKSFTGRDNKGICGHSRRQSSKRNRRGTSPVTISWQRGAIVDAVSLPANISIRDNMTSSHHTSSTRPSLASTPKSGSCPNLVIDYTAPPSNSQETRRRRRRVKRSKSFKQQGQSNPTQDGSWSNLMSTSFAVGNSTALNNSCHFITGSRIRRHS